MIKNRITYIIVLVVLGLLIFLYEAPITYTAFFAALILPVLSLGLALLTRRQFTVSERLSEHNIIKGETTQYSFGVRNNNFLPCTSVRVRFKGNSSAIVTDFADHYFSLPAYKSHRVVFNITAKYRGTFEVGVLGITMYDFLGLFRFEQPHDKTLTLTVRPRVLEISSLPLAFAEGDMDHTKNYLADEDYAVISDLRKYQPTDGYKKIHWKASAKKNELISKNYQSHSRNMTAFVVDNSVVEGDEEAALIMEDAIMECCVSAMAYCIRRQHFCSVYFMGGDDNAGASGNFDYLYNVASIMPFGLHDNFGLYLINFSKMQTHAENLVILTKNISDYVFASAQTLRSLGNNVMIVYFEPPEQKDLEKIERLNDLSIFCGDFQDIMSS